MTYHMHYYEWVERSCVACKLSQEDTNVELLSPEEWNRGDGEMVGTKESAVQLIDFKMFLWCIDVHKVVRSVETVGL